MLRENEEKDRWFASTISALRVFYPWKKISQSYLCGSPLGAAHLGILEDSTRTYKGRSKIIKNPKLFNTDFALEFVNVLELSLSSTLDCMNIIKV